MLRLASRTTTAAPARASRSPAVTVRALWGSKPGDAGKAKRQDEQWETQQAILRERREKAAQREAQMRGPAAGAKPGARGRAAPPPPPPARRSPPARQQQVYIEEEEEEYEEYYEEDDDEPKKKGGLGGLIGGLFKRR